MRRRLMLSKSESLFYLQQLDAVQDKWLYRKEFMLRLASRCTIADAVSGKKGGSRAFQGKRGNSLPYVYL